MSAKGFIWPEDGTTRTWCWSLRGAKRFVDRQAKKRDFKTVEQAMFRHYEA